nr:MAG TPA: hypothetical protein [Bacteriophage sp.]
MAREQTKVIALEALCVWVTLEPRFLYIMWGPSPVTVSRIQHLVIDRLRYRQPAFIGKSPRL